MTKGLVQSTKQRYNNFLPSHFLLEISRIFFGGVSFLPTKKKKKNLSPGQWLALLLSVPGSGVLWVGVMLWVILPVRARVQSWGLGSSGSHGFCLFFAQR